MVNKSYKNKIDKLLLYALGFKPDEFFLIPDEDGYVKIKDLLKAFHEKKDLRWINKGEINSYLATDNNPVIEIQGNLIRAKSRENITQISIADKIPGQLYTCIRKKAWPHVHDKGLFPKDNKIILTDNKDLSISIGRRIDNEPVLLYISTKKAFLENIDFYKFGENIYLADFLKKSVIKGPSIEKILARKETSTIKTEKKPETPGTFTPKIHDVFINEGKKEGQKGSWKKNKKKLRRSKKEHWPDQ